MSITYRNPTYVKLRGSTIKVNVKHVTFTDKEAGIIWGNVPKQRYSPPPYKPPPLPKTMPKFNIPRLPERNSFGIPYTDPFKKQREEQVKKDAQRKQKQLDDQRKEQLKRLQDMLRKQREDNEKRNKERMLEQQKQELKRTQNFQKQQRERDQEFQRQTAEKIRLQQLERNKKMFEQITNDQFKTRKITDIDGSNWGNIANDPTRIHKIAGVSISEQDLLRAGELLEAERLIGTDKAARLFQPGFGGKFTWGP